MWQAGPAGSTSSSSVSRVAVYAQFAHALHVAGGGAFVPQFLAAAAPEVRLAGFAGLALQGFGVHPGHHEDLGGGGILDHGRDQAPFVKAKQFQ